jgi:D-glycero-alpha-D-manno-heptose-7-phosphate kinase
MIIIRAPFRISLFGGGTDFKWYYSEKKTRVVSFSIDKYCYVTIRQLLPYFGFKYRACWSLIEESLDIEEITHPSIRACIRESGVKDGLEIHTVGDLPARSGLGSSSAFTASMIKGLREYVNKEIASNELIRETIRIEQEILKEEVGIQDQIAVCQGGFGVTRINNDSTFSTIYMDNNEPIVDMIDRQLILVYSGIDRISSDEQAKKMVSRLKMVGRLDRLREIAFIFSDALLNGTATFDLLTTLMIESWNEKRKTLEGTSNLEELDSIYELAIKSGASSGKLLGAGGGGFFAFFVPAEEQDAFTQRMKDYVCIKASICYRGVERVR